MSQIWSFCRAKGYEKSRSFSRSLHVDIPIFDSLTLHETLEVWTGPQVGTDSVDKVLLMMAYPKWYQDYVTRAKY